ncbi:hairy and enhancer of split transcription factor C [Apostichopus japonicus]|uniref:Hairy and enhancer of split transcription factor C n=1 Tax=Stichopus japonicus TaxID=307972 RepID=A0A2G8JQ79_STIJA|nr:hairy and enhancer of split transcription factor C [Apostichopus japonicus]
MAPTLQSDSRQIKSRRVSKHLTERKRRARINDSLLQLKTIVYPAVKDEVVQNSKMEKADILDMTLRYVKDIQQKKREVPCRYSECLSQVSNFLTSSESMSLETRRRLLTYLADKCLTGTAMDESKQTGSHLAPPSPTETRISPPTPHRMPSLPVSSPSIVYIVPAQAIQPLTQAMVVPQPQCSPTYAVTSPVFNTLPTPPHSPVSAKQHSPAADNGYHKTVLADASLIAASVIPMVTVSTPVSSATQDSNVWRPW